MLAAPGSELEGWLRKGRATAAIVRPDRAVMQAGRNIQAICDAMPPSPQFMAPRRSRKLTSSERAAGAQRR